MNKKQNWLPILKKAIKKKKKKSFKWGKNDCALFASDLLKSMTGVDPAQWFRGKYNSKLGAYKSLLKSPFSKRSDTFNRLFKSVVDALAHKHGMKRKNVSYRQRGDLGLVKNHKNRYTMSIFVGSGFACVGSETGKGITLRDNDKCDYLWGVD